MHVKNTIFEALRRRRATISNHLSCFVCCGFASLVGGMIAFCMILRWFPVGEMLRSLALDSLLFALLLLLPARIGKVLLSLAFPVILLTALLNTTHMILYQSAISGFAIQAVLETSPAEAREFVTDHLATFPVPGFIVLIGLIALGVLLFRTALRALPRLGHGPMLSCFALLIIGVVGWNIHKKDKRLLDSNITYVIASTIFHYQREASVAHELRNLRDSLHIQDIRLLDGPASARRTYVFIINESVNRNRMSLYGYYRPTSPCQEALREQGDILAFTDVVSSHTHTHESIPDALLLREANPAPDREAWKEPSLLTLLNQAGFTTWWLSNQTANTTKHGNIALISGDARYQVWLNRARHEGQSVNYDVVLLPVLEQALRDPAPNKAIFLHYLGAHQSYALRYPPEENFFSSTDDIPDRAWREGKGKHYINTYDNAIRYSDKMVDAVIRMVRQEEGRSLVIHFSDHGQEVYDLRPMRGQDSRNPTRNMFDIPFTLWFSPAYAEANPDLVSQARSAVSASFWLKDFASTAADLARVRFKDFDATRSLVSPDYNPQPRIMPNGRCYDNLPKETGQP